jgi:hypothetical protein
MAWVADIEYQPQESKIRLGPGQSIDLMASTSNSVTAGMDGDADDDDDDDDDEDNDENDDNFGLKRSLTIVKMGLWQATDLSNSEYK